MDRIDRMELFRRIVETGSLSAAARARGVSLPTVSRTLQALEDELEVELLRRSTRRISVTEAGRRYYDHCVRIAAELERGRAAVSEGHAERSLVVSAPVTIGVLHVGDMIAELLDANPELRVDLRLEERLIDFVADGVDVAIRAGQPATGSNRYIARKLGRVARVLVASPDYLDAFGRPEQPADLAEHEAIVTLTARGPDHLWRLTRGEREYTVGVRGRLRSTTLLANFRGALAGLGIALVPRWLASEALADGRLELVLPHFEAPTIDLFAVYRARDRGSPVLTALVTSMRRALSP